MLTIDPLLRFAVAQKALGPPPVGRRAADAAHPRRDAPRRHAAADAGGHAPADLRRHERRAAPHVPGEARGRLRVRARRRRCGSASTRSCRTAARARCSARSRPRFRASRTSACRRCCATCASEEKGLVLVTGPTGSGKSTTLAAMIDYINETMRRAHPHARGSDRVRAHSRSAAWSTSARSARRRQSFTDALRSALREDPDVILVGEMRDLETDLARADRGRDRAPRVRHAAHARARRRPSTASSTCSRRRSRRRSARCCPSRCSASSTQMLLREGRRRPRRGARDPGRHAGGAQPDPRGQDAPDPVGDAGRRARSACRRWRPRVMDLVSRGRRDASTRSASAMPDARRRRSSATSAARRVTTSVPSVDATWDPMHARPARAHGRRSRRRTSTSPPAARRCSGSTASATRRRRRSTPSDRARWPTR